MVIKLSVNLIETNQKAKRKNLLAVPGAVGLYFFSFHFVQFMLHFISIIIEQRKKGKVKVNRSYCVLFFFLSWLIYNEEELGLK